MAGKRRRRAGDGMAPLFDLEQLLVPHPHVATDPARERDVTRATAAVPTPVEYWVRGVFRCGDGQFTRTVQAIGMSTRLDTDVARFITYLTTDGFGFAEGRGYLSELLGVGADDGKRISLGRHTEYGRARVE